MKNDRIYSWMNKKIAVKNSGKYGNGIYATEPIKKGEILAIIGGYIITREEEDKLPEKIRDVGIQIEPGFTMGIIKEDQLSNTDYINHSCNPNAGVKGQITIVALRNIKKEEEITFDYGMVLYREKDGPKYELDCLCGSKNCRKKITQNDWKNPVLQKKYNGYFSYYIQEKINKLTKNKRK